jgi:hypothetical protein
MVCFSRDGLKMLKKWIETFFFSFFGPKQTKKILYTESKGFFSGRKYFSFLGHEKFYMI